MNLYRFCYVAEHGADSECELYAQSWDHAREVFREDFGNMDYTMYIVEEDSEYEELMDGDFDSAMASAGFGTDEDYGYAEDVL